MFSTDKTIFLDKDESKEFLDQLMHPDVDLIKRTRESLKDIIITETKDGFIADIPNFNLDFIKKEN